MVFSSVTLERVPELVPEVWDVFHEYKASTLNPAPRQVLAR